jgi:hypothetical protein
MKKFTNPKAVAVLKECQTEMEKFFAEMDKKIGVAGIKVGSKVIKDGYSGTVTEVCSWDSELIVVRLDSGSSCLARSTFSGQYQNNYIVEL